MASSVGCDYLDLEFAFVRPTAAAAVAAAAAAAAAAVVAGNSYPFDAV